MFKFVFAVSALFLGALASSDCPVDRQVKCVDQFKQALPYCKKASESKGSDKDADLNCLKYAYQMDKQCWPCICYIAQKQNLKVLGC